MSGKSSTFADNFKWISEPQLWYNVGRWFGCPNLNIGTEIEFSYNRKVSGLPKWQRCDRWHDS